MYGVRQYGMHTLLYFLTEVNTTQIWHQIEIQIWQNTNTDMNSNIGTNDILSFLLFKGQLLSCVHFTQFATLEPFFVLISAFEVFLSDPSLIIGNACH